MRRGNRLIVGLLASLSLLVMIGFLVGSTKAQNNIIRTILCDTNSTPIVTVLDPQSDSLVDQPLINVSGQTEQTTQIDIFVNDAYSSSVAVEPSGSFAVNVPLAKGNNTIRLDAYFSCNQNSASEVLIITYEPKVQPSEGADTDTDIEYQPDTTSQHSERPINPSSDQPGVSKDDGLYQKIREKLFIQPDDNLSGSTFRRAASPIINWAGVITLLSLVVSLGFPAFALAALGLKTHSTILGISSVKFIRIISVLAGLLILVGLLIL